MNVASYQSVRRDYILVHHEPECRAIHVLLRAGTESAVTRDRLRALGVAPEVSSTSVGWLLQTNDVDRSLRDIAEALGSAALFDAGTSFDAAGACRRSSAVPVEWRGHHLIHVGGTRRCLLLERGTDGAEIERAFNAEEEAYFANDFHPATE